MLLRNKNLTVERLLEALKEGERSVCVTYEDGEKVNPCYLFAKKGKIFRDFGLDMTRPFFLDRVVLIKLL